MAAPSRLSFSQRQALTVQNDPEVQRLWAEWATYNKYPESRMTAEGIARKMEIRRSLEQRVTQLGGLPPTYSLQSDPSTQRAIVTPSSPAVTGSGPISGGGSTGFPSAGSSSSGFKWGDSWGWGDQSGMPGGSGGGDYTMRNPYANVGGPPPLRWEGEFQTPQVPTSGTAAGLRTIGTTDTPQTTSEGANTRWKPKVSFGESGGQTGITGAALGGKDIFTQPGTTKPITNDPPQSSNFDWNSVIKNYGDAISSLLGAYLSGERGKNVAQTALYKKKLEEYNRTSPLRQGLEVSFNQQLPSHLQNNLPQNFLTNSNNGKPREFDYSQFPIYPY
jgi:hypothetical protein